MPGDITTLHMCTKNDHMIFDSWDMASDRWTDAWTNAKSDK